MFDDYLRRNTSNPIYGKSIVQLSPNRNYITPEEREELIQGHMARVAEEMKHHPEQGKTNLGKLTTFE